MCKYLPSELAAAAIYLSTKILKQPNDSIYSVLEYSRE